MWIDNLEFVNVRSHVCISQEVYLCTGSHDWTSAGFDLIARPILIQAHAWLGARTSIAPGVNVGEGAVLALGSTATTRLESWHIYQGNPAAPIKPRYPGYRAVHPLPPVE